MRRLATGWAPVAGVMILAAAGCGDGQPTGPALEAPAAAAPTENNGNGAEFTIIQGVPHLFTLVDEEGNVCDIAFSEQEGSKSRSDFFRTNPDGSLSIHANDSDAPLFI